MMHERLKIKNYECFFMLLLIESKIQYWVRLNHRTEIRSLSLETKGLKEIKTNNKMSVKKMD